MTELASDGASLERLLKTRSFLSSQMSHQIKVTRKSKPFLLPLCTRLHAEAATSWGMHRPAKEQGAGSPPDAKP
jgi:hypothetical protein